MPWPAELVLSFCYYWRDRGNEAEQRKWENVLEDHLELVEQGQPNC
ncbi:hypothetical protein [Aeromonas caviae]